VRRREVEEEEEGAEGEKAASVYACVYAGTL